MKASDFLIENGGRLDPDWFAPHDAEDLLDAWITVGGTSNEVYLHAFQYLCDDIMMNPAMQRDRDKMDSYSGRQLDYWRAQVEHYRWLVSGNSGVVVVDWMGK